MHRNGTKIKDENNIFDFCNERMRLPVTVRKLLKSQKCSAVIRIEKLTENKLKTGKARILLKH